jgi:hypothetical protein
MGGIELRERVERPSSVGDSRSPRCKLECAIGRRFGRSGVPHEVEIGLKAYWSRICNHCLSKNVEIVGSPKDLTLSFGFRATNEEARKMRRFSHADHER